MIVQWNKLEYIQCLCTWDAAEAIFSGGGRWLGPGPCWRGRLELLLLLLVAGQLEK